MQHGEIFLELKQLDLFIPIKLFEALELAGDTAVPHQLQPYSGADLPYPVESVFLGLSISLWAGLCPEKGGPQSRCVYAFCSAGGLTQVVSIKLISRVTSCSNRDSSGMGSPWSRVFVLREDKSLRTQAEGVALNESAHTEKCQPLEGERPNDCQKLVRSWVGPPCLLWPPRAHGCKAGQGCGGHAGHPGTPGAVCLDQPAAEIERGEGKENGQFP